MVLCLTACGTTAAHTTDIKPTLAFADRTDAEIVRMLDAAIGLEIRGSTQDFSLDLPCPTVTVDGTALRTDLAYSCHVVSSVCDNSCVKQCAPEGSGLELVGVGGALISGTWETRSPGPIVGGAKLILRGADTLTATSDLLASSWQWQIE